MKRDYWRKAWKDREEVGRGLQKDWMQLKHELCISENRAQSINLCNQCEFITILKFENKEVERRMVADRD